MTSIKIQKNCFTAIKNWFLRRAQKKCFPAIWNWKKLVPRYFELEKH